MSEVNVCNTCKHASGSSCGWLKAALRPLLDTDEPDPPELAEHQAWCRAQRWNAASVPIEPATHCPQWRPFGEPIRELWITDNCMHKHRSEDAARRCMLGTLSKAWLWRNGRVRRWRDYGLGRVRVETVATYTYWRKSKQPGVEWEIMTIPLEVAT